MLFNFTPEDFVDVVLLGLYWEYGEKVPHRPRKGKVVSEREWTTVGHVLKVLVGIDAITDLVVKMIQHREEGVAYQRKLYHHCGIIYSSDHIMINIHSWILCKQGSKSKSIVPYASLVRDLRIQIVDAGIGRALSLERAYGESLSKEKYLAEARRIHELEKAPAEEEELG